VALVACSTSSQTSSGSPATGGAPTGSAAGPSAAGTRSPGTTALPTGPYVALGSSFAAGPGIPPQDDANCARSKADYPHQVAQQLGLTVVDVTCSAATTDNFTQPQGTAPPQLDAITADTGLVTITMGGNDIGYSVTSLSCLSKANAGQPCDPPAPDATLQATTKMTAALVSTIRTIQQRAPHAQIYVVPYLDVYPEPGRSCPPDNPISDDSSRTIANMGATLADGMRAAADQTGVRYVDVYDASKGHDVCSGKDTRFVEGAKVENTGLNYHPNPAGMAEYTKLIVAAVQGS
jgi:lysophospholipase L1-like esterase